MRLTRILLVAVVLFTISCGDDEKPRAVGEDCENDSACADGTCLTELPGGLFWDPLKFPDGYCSAECETAGEPCLDGAGVCLYHSATGLQYCFSTCETEDECREDYTCYRFDDSAACIPEDAAQ